MLKEQKTGAFVIALGNADILLVQRKDPPFKGSWSPPGGSCRWGENPKVAAVRETREETGQIVRTISLLDVMDFKEENSHYIAIFYEASPTKANARAKVVVGEDVMDAKWISLSDLHKLYVPEFLFSLLKLVGRKTL